MKTGVNIQKAYKIALKARRNSHSPYSKFKVGAALKLKGEDEAIGGCNVENASYGATMCAERTALFRAVAEHGKIKPEFLVIVTGEKNATAPCGLCLQALAEFCADDMKVYLGNEQEILVEKEFKDFLPHAFRVFEAEE
jgi:homotetrameric cytidine deaminase